MRTSTIVLIAVLAAAALALRPLTKNLEGYTFERYMSDFGRTYSVGSTEWKQRKAIFDEKVAEVRAHNADTTQSYRKGINHFSDWTAEEFKAYNRAKRPTPEVLARMTQYAFKNSSLPKEVDYRRASPPVLTGVKNQGHCGSCWAHSTVETVESFFAIKYGQLSVLSQQQVSACDSSMNGCGGGDYFAGWEYISQSKGLNEEWLYPYTDFFAKSFTKAATSQCVNITAKYAVANFPWLPKANITNAFAVTPNSAEATMEALSLYGPLSISVGAGDWSSYAGGIFHNNPGTTTPWEIDHAVQLVGYGYDFDVQENYWIVRNSWGTNWGEDGYIRLYRPANEPCGFAEGQESCGTSGLLNSPGFPEVSQLQKLNP